MIRTHVAAEGRAVVRDGPGGGGWIEVVAPDAEEQKSLASTLGLHELALEDALRVAHPPKVEEFGDHLFVIAHTPSEDDDRVTRKISLFLAKGWLVTILRAPLDETDAVLARVRKNPAKYLDHPATLAHVILDTMSDGFEVRVDELREQVGELEERALAEPEPGQMADILEFRREVVALARTVRGQRDVFLTLSRTEHAVLPKKIRPYYRDIYDHVLRVHDLLEGVREQVGAARDAYLASINNRLSEVMRVLTIIATIMMPLSLLAGVYGMNFNKMPGTDSPLGFWLLLIAMALVAISMLVFFRKRKWL
ncbi:MAG: magnesium/cobalt transporter CorA [Planctomycetota bacterium]|nr:magnesium/cobalt transporter CorA [Planctomycetota bacterium]